MVVAKDQKTHEGMVNLFSVHDIERRYEALIVGKPRTLSGTITTTLGRHPTNRLKMAANVKNGKKAITHYQTLQSNERATHMEFKLETGRTHQIRVHASQMLQTPIFCDPVYGAGSSHINKLPVALKELLTDYPYQLLHAKELGFIHPITGEKLHFKTEPPQIFKDALEAFFPSI